MITKQQYKDNTEKTLKAFEKAGIALTEKEKCEIEVADFNLSDLNRVGLQLLVYVNTERVCAKEMYLLANQTCPQHRHIITDGKPGKEETFRCRRGLCYLYVEGEGKKEDAKAQLPPTDVNVFHEIVLRPGQEYTIKPFTWHWFQAGTDGAIISEFSTHSTDETDEFLDKRILRAPEVK
jgi:D-lyxose ketol-isomerase